MKKSDYIFLASWTILAYMLYLCNPYMSILPLLCAVGTIIIYATDKKKV